jgi:sodium-coupled neutral amino acid transporter 11
MIQFPAACYYKLLSEPWYGRRKLCAAACTGFGIIVMFLSLILALRKIFTGEGVTNKVCT